MNDAAAASEQFLDEALANKAGRAGDEISHRVSPKILFVLYARSSLARTRGAVLHRLLF